ncbi:MAG: DUF4156 domain-containing protein [Arenimonas sp.]|nr:DUF4156 domain-containing protein [Arenimonas sp.]
MRQLLVCALVVTALGGCTWVKMAPGGSDVRVVSASQDITACEKRGEVSVSVKDSLGPYERNDLRVRDELETLARNEAPGLQADTIQPRGEPTDGEQRFAAFRCGPAAPKPTAAAAAEVEDLPAGEAKTYPIQD